MNIEDQIKGSYNVVITDISKDGADNIQKTLNIVFPNLKVYVVNGDVFKCLNLGKE